MKKTAAAPTLPAPSDPSLDDEINKFLTEDEEGLEGEGGGEEDELETLPPGVDKASDLIRGSVEPDSWDNIIYDPEKQKWERQIEIAMIRGTNALILVGESGVGKTTMIKSIAAKHLETPIAYFNAPNMDPFIHLIGLPHISKNPATDELVLAFVRKSGIEASELLVLDEINRVNAASQNALFELVNAQQINGENIGHVRMVWGAMNPPRQDIEVSVEKLERAFQGRFKKVIIVKAEPRMRHYVFPGSQIGERVARICLRWWYQLIQGKGAEGVQYQDIVTPRVLEYIMETCQFLEDWRNGKWPKLGKLTNKEWNTEFETVCQHHHLSEDTTEATIPFTQLRQAFHGHEMYGLEDLLDSSPQVTKKLAEIAAKPEAAKMAASVILQGIKVTRLHPLPLMQFYRIGEFSRVLTAMKPADANLIINGKPEIAGFLAAKCLNISIAMEKHPDIFGGTFSPESIAQWQRQFPQEAAAWEQEKRLYSKNNAEHDVFKPVTPGEMAIFNHLKYDIVRAVKKSGSYRKPTGPGTPGAAPGATPGVGAGATPGAVPAAPVKKPGVP